MTSDQTRAGRPITRRRALTTTAAGAAGFVAASRLGFPAHRPRAGRHHQDRPPHAAHRLPRPARRVRLQGATLAVEEANAAGGVLGRKIELIAEDSVNPGDRGQQGAEADRARQGRLPDRRDQLGLGARDRRAGANRYKTVYFNTGANSDALRGSNCNRYMFHVEGCNTMYTKTIGHMAEAAEPDQGRASGIS